MFVQAIVYVNVVRQRVPSRQYKSTRRVSTSCGHALRIWADFQPQAKAPYPALAVARVSYMFK